MRKKSISSFYRNPGINKRIAKANRFGMKRKPPSDGIEVPSGDELDAALQENIRLGFMVENPDGTFSVTEAGIKHVESLRKRD